MIKRVPWVIFIVAVFIGTRLLIPQLLLHHYYTLADILAFVSPAAAIIALVVVLTHQDSPGNNPRLGQIRLIFLLILLGIALIILGLFIYGAFQIAIGLAS